MELRKATRESCSRLKELYLEAFPPDEQAPFWCLVRRAACGRAKFMEITVDGLPVGLFYIIRYKDLTYIFYLAVNKDLRGRGYGSKAIELLKRKYAGYRLFLSLECPDETAPNAEQRRERYEFYRRCGFEDLHHRVKEGGVVFSLMGTGGIVGADEYIRMINHTLGPVYRRLVGFKFVD